MGADPQKLFKMLSKVQSKELPSSNTKFSHKRFLWSAGISEVFVGKNCPIWLPPNANNALPTTHKFF